MGEGREWRVREGLVVRSQCDLVCPVAHRRVVLRLRSCRCRSVLSDTRSVFGWGLLGSKLFEVYLFGSFKLLHLLGVREPPRVLLPRLLSLRPLLPRLLDLLVPLLLRQLGVPG